MSATRPRGACTERNKERTSGAVEEAVISRELTLGGCALPLD